MTGFDRLTHTAIYFGKGKIKEFPSIIAEKNDILFVYGNQTIKRNGLYQYIKESLDKSNKRYYELGGVVSNPSISLVYEGIKICQEKKIKFILAVGGGSVIDTAKAISVGACYNGDVWELFNDSQMKIEKALPIGVILTNFGSGSEVSDSAVLSNDETKLKRYIMSEHLVPKFAIMDSSMLETMSKKQIGCAFIDTFSHSFERYFVTEDEKSFLDGVLVSLMKETIALAKEYLNTPCKSELFDQMMWISAVSHMGITETGRCGDWGTHDLAHELGQEYNMPHGEAVAISLRAWLKYNLRKKDSKRVRAFFDELGDKDGVILTDISFICKEFGIRSQMSKKELNNKIIEELSKRVMRGRTTAGGAFLPLTEQISKEIYEIMTEDNDVMITEKELKNKMSDCANKLREAYYEHHKNEVINEDICAFGGSENESIGPWPEFNLRGIHCNRSKCGLCTPCFYSKFANIIGIENDCDNIRALKEQIDGIVNEMDRLSKTLNNDESSSNNVAYLQETLRFKDKKPMALCITPVGSFFDDKEMYPEVAKYLLEKLVEKSNDLGRDIILYVEAHVDDFLRNHKNGKINELLHYYKALHLRVVFGFESKNDFVRNVLYRKNLSLNRFEEAVKEAKSYGFGVFAFVFAGLYPMTEKEIYNDVSESFDYLKELNVRPVLMISNTQPFTISEVLQYCNVDTLIEPKTFAKIIKLMLEKFGVDVVDGIDPWLAADPVGGPPDPIRHIFKRDVINKIYTCDACTELVRNAFSELRLTMNKEAFNEAYDKIMLCSESDKYEQFYNIEPKESLYERTCKMLELVMEHIDEYIEYSNKRELTKIKAGLLCEGAILDEETQKLISDENHLLDSEFVHASNLKFRDIVINMNLDQGFAKNSRFRINSKKSNGVMYSSLSCEGEFCGEIEFLPLPVWAHEEVDGEKIYNWLRPHSENCISIWPNSSCALKEKCKFCTLDGIKSLSPQTVVKMIDIALDTDPHYDVNLGGGIYKSEEENIEYFCQIASGIREKHSNKISLETVPPRTKEGLERYKKAGVTTMIMNLEISNDDLRKKICPSKSEISKQRYYDAFEEAVELFGEWKVASVLIAGIQPDEDIINESRAMVAKKVIPIIMPYQPIKANGNGKLQSERYVDVASKVADIIEAGKSNVMQSVEACVKCGACSLENVLLSKGKSNKGEH